MRSPEDSNRWISGDEKLPAPEGGGGNISGFGSSPEAHSSVSIRHLGCTSKRGDKYLRMLLTHGARASLRAATVALQAGRKVDALRRRT